MPHLIIEFAQGQAGDAQVEALLDAVHHAAATTGLFEASHIRVRAYPVAYYRLGGEQRPFIHAQLRIHSGRSLAQRQALSQAILTALHAQQWPAQVITVEVVEMERASYAKYAR